MGFHTGGGKVNKVSSVNHNFPPHVVQAAQVGTCWQFPLIDAVFFLSYATIVHELYHILTGF